VNAYTFRLFERAGGKPALPKSRCSKNGNVRSLNPNRVGIPKRISILVVVQVVPPSVVQGATVHALTKSPKLWVWMDKGIHASNAEPIIVPAIPLATRVKTPRL
jgi:hypothetical protein